MATQKTLKVGKWWNNFDEKQQAAFKRFMTHEFFDLQRTRKFLTAAKKEFGDGVEYLKNGMVRFEGDLYSYMRDHDGWYKHDWSEDNDNK